MQDFDSGEWVVGSFGVGGWRESWRGSRRFVRRCRAWLRRRRMRGARVSYSRVSAYRILSAAKVIKD